LRVSRRHRLQTFVPSFKLHRHGPADKPEKFDEEVEAHGIRILIDSKALLHIIGTKMDFVEDRIKREFVFENPNAKGTCGCGESFTT